MYRSRRVLILIPARGGSKRIPKKNTKLLGGEPLISYAIRAAKGSRFADRTIVSTDSADIAAIARRFGAETPFLRPRHLATDASPVASAVIHTLDELQKKESWRPDVVVLVQPTSPFVRSKDIDEAIATLIQSGANSCVSVTEVRERPEWMFALKKKMLKKKFPTTLFKRSQDMPPLYRLNGAVYASHANVIRKKSLIFDPKKAAAVIMPIDRSLDIDYPFDWKVAERIHENNQNRR
ncbi:MAG: CMP-N-acetylneuraminic acid synthetase [Parcubacteria group bacterium GW2011_GWA2_51_10]|nr:MAG: CMP-N-acetylneuraminic acid synthetase [Parcubacteria group bacterium GW2011_GWA2_51_10]